MTSGRGSEQVKLLDLHRALEALARENAALAQVVEMHYFGGMTAEEAAVVSARSVQYGTARPSSRPGMAAAGARPQQLPPQSKLAWTGSHTIRGSQRINASQVPERSVVPRSWCPASSGMARAGAPRIAKCERNVWRLFRLRHRRHVFGMRTCGPSRNRRCPSRSPAARGERLRRLARQAVGGV